MPPGMMHETEDVATGEDLARFLYGSPDSFTGMLIQLIAKADYGNRHKLRETFPAQVITWEIWSQLEEIPSAGELRALVGMVWPSDIGVPDFSIILDLLTDYKHGRITLPARAGS